MERCRICKKEIDKGECGSRFTVITINDDRGGKFIQERFYLCNMCTYGLERFCNMEMETCLR